MTEVQEFVFEPFQECIYLNQAPSVRKNDGWSRIVISVWSCYKKEDSKICLVEDLSDEYIIRGRENVLEDGQFNFPNILMRWVPEERKKNYMFVFVYNIYKDNNETEQRQSKLLFNFSRKPVSPEIVRSIAADIGNLISLFSKLLKLIGINDMQRFISQYNKSINSQNIENNQIANALVDLQYPVEASVKRSHPDEIKKASPKKHKK